MAYRHNQRELPEAPQADSEEIYERPKKKGPVSQSKRDKKKLRKLKDRPQSQ